MSWLTGLVAGVLNAQIGRHYGSVALSALAGVVAAAVKAAGPAAGAPIVRAFDVKVMPWSLCKSVLLSELVLVWGPE
jgi:hypothetical protein